MKKPVRRKQRDEGIALMIALLVIVLLTVIVVAFSYEMQVDASLVENQIDELESYLAAKSAISLGMALLAQDILDPSSDGTDSMLDAWYVETHPDNLPLGRWERMPVPDGAELKQQEYLLKIEDEFGKFNINALIDPLTLEPNQKMIDILANLFAQIGAPEDPTEAILDWIDQDEDGSFEASYYGGLEIPYLPKNGPMDSIEELLMIAGITPDVYFGSVEDNIPALYDLLTVHGNRLGNINVNTARYELLLAMGEATGNGGYADTIVARRESSPYIDTDSINDEIGSRQTPDMTPQQVDEMLARRPPHDTYSRAFHIQGDGMVNGVVTRIDAYVWRAPQGEGVEQYRIMEWRVTR